MQLINLTTKYLGRNFVFYKKLDSTQSEIWRLIENNKIANGQLVMADIQTNGKGTHGRIWHTDEEKNIAFSIFIILLLIYTFGKKWVCPLFCRPFFC